MFTLPTKIAALGYYIPFLQILIELLLKNLGLFWYPAKKFIIHTKFLLTRGK